MLLLKKDEAYRVKLPFPPSGNTNLRFGKGGRAYTPTHILMYREKIKKLINSTFKDSLLKVKVEFYPPNQRKRDIDNHLKVLLDSLMHAKLFEDDSQIKELFCYMHDLERKDCGNHCIVTAKYLLRENNK